MFSLSLSKKKSWAQNASSLKTESGFRLFCLGYQDLPWKQKDLHKSRDDKGISSVKGLNLFWLAFKGTTVINQSLRLLLCLPKNKLVISDLDDCKSLVQDQIPSFVCPSVGEDGGSGWKLLCVFLWGSIISCPKQQLARLMLHPRSSGPQPISQLWP